MKAASNVALMEILLQHNKYLNWLPFDRVEERARLYLKDGRPFTRISSGDKAMITTITIIRNAIAHKSPHALVEFERKVMGVKTLLPRERTPGGYLRSSASATPPVNQFEVYIGELGRIASSLC